VASPPNLPAAFLRHSAADPEEPWLFRAEEWDWRWHPWGELARWLNVWSERLSAFPAATRASFLDRFHPESAVLDLAIQAAGLLSVPASGPQGEIDLWIEIENGGLKTSLPVPLSPRQANGDAGGAVVRIGDGEVTWTAADLIAAGERLQHVIGTSGGREIVVLGGPLVDPVERSMMSWATLTGAAVVLEPDPALRAATAAWARPTLFHGTPGEIAALRARAGKGRKGWLPFRRLRTLLVVGDLPAEEDAFWRERGVAVRRVQASLAFE
jgi:hypothetical protein